MASTFNEFIEKNSSEKIVCAWLHPRERILTGWNSGAAPVYSIVTDKYVNQVLNLTEGSTSSPAAGEYYYDDITSTLYLRHAADEDPRDVFTVLEYRLFYSSGPVTLPYDLNTGRDVEYEGRLESISKFKEELDPDDMNGIALTGSGNIGLTNTDNGLAPIYNNLFWVSTKCEIFLGSPSILPSEFKKIFIGFIDAKTYGTSVKFTIKNFIDKLRDQVPLPLYSSSDGDIPDSIISKPKPRIYGRVAGKRCQPLDMVLDGFELTGTFTKSGTNTIAVTGGDLLNELSPFDSVFFIDEFGEEISYDVDAVSSSQITVSDDIEEVIDAATMFCLPEISYRGKNRTHLVAGHELKEPSTTVTDYIQSNRIEVASTEDIEADDVIYIGTVKAIVRRIIGNEIVLKTNLSAVPVNGTVVKKIGIQSVHYKKKELVFNRDWTFSNLSEAKLVLDPLAEFNIAPAFSLAGNLTFTNGLTTVSGSGFKNLIKSRDWVKPDGTAIWYEVLSNDSDTQLTLRVAYQDANITATARRKSPDYIDDDSIITVDCLGKKNAAGDWINTASHIVRDLLIEAGLSDQLNTTAFDSAEIEMPYLPSISLPFSFGGGSPTLRDVIDRVNKSVFGSLYADENYEIVYKVLSPNKENITDIVREDDTIRYTTESTGKNVAKIINANYRHYDYDRLSDTDDGAFSLEIENESISNLSSISRAEPVNLYLYDVNEANIMAHRISLLRESANTVIKLRSGLKFVNKSLNTPVYLELDDVPDRLGTNDSNYIGYISFLSRGENETNIQISDLSNMYAKICVFAETADNDYTSTTKIDRARYGFFTDDYTLVNNEKNTYRLNLWA